MNKSTRIFLLITLTISLISCSNEKKETQGTLSNSSSTVSHQSSEHIDTKKEMYLNKIQDVENSFSDLEYLYENENSNEMGYAEEQKYKRWDQALNQIYQDMMMSLTEEEKEQLQQDQRKWIPYRDQEADHHAKEFISTTSYGMELHKKLAELTKQRCLELIESYSK